VFPKGFKATMSHPEVSRNGNETEWIEAIERELSNPPYRDVMLKSSRMTIPIVFNLLRLAAEGLKYEQEKVARVLVSDALEELEEIIKNGFCSRKDIAPILDMIKSKIPSTINPK
jgi:hypothetical protein